MSPSFLFQIAVVVSIAVTGTAYLAKNSAMTDADPTETVEIATKAPEKPKSASVVSIPRTSGQFFTQGRVNSGTVRFLVDTGASSVALTLNDARRAGVNVQTLNYTTPVDTANGRTMAATVTLKEIRIGGIRVRNVRALVLKEGLHISLLGMTFLGELQKVEATPSQLILRL